MPEDTTTPAAENAVPETPATPEADAADPKSPLEAFIYHQRRALEETSKALDALIPPDVREHSSEAGRQFVKGFKVLVDAAISEIEKAANKVQEVKSEGETEAGAEAPKPEAPRPSTIGKTKIKVVVE